MSNLFYRIDSKNNIGVGTNQIVATNDFSIDFETCSDTNSVIKLNGNLGDALNIKQGNESYMKFVTTNSNEEIVLNKNSTINGKIQINDTTQNTSTDGSLQTNGGLSVGLDAVIGNDLKLLSDNAVLSLGENSDATLTYDGTNGLTIAANPISIDSTNSLDLSSTTGDINFQTSGTNQLSIDMDGTGEVIMQLKKDSDDFFVFKQFDGTEVFRVEDNGYFDIAGGAGNSGVTITSSGQLIIDGKIQINDTTQGTLTDGSLQTNGGLSVASNAVIGNHVKLLSNNAVLSLGENSDATLTHDGTTGLTIAANPISIDSTGVSTNAIHINATAGGVDIDANKILALDSDSGINIGISSNVPIDINASTLDIDASGELTLTQIQVYLLVQQLINQLI